MTETPASVVCSACAHENRAGAKFCEECATPIRPACASCGSALRPTAKFCDECGTPVVGTAPARPQVPAASARKVVTVVFADLAGSTALHERVDPESARRMMEAYYEALRGAVLAHGGTVVKLLGDGVMAAFGVPHVAEDDAIRAVRAGVAMQEAFRGLLDEQAAVLGDVALRVAINTGEVVVSGANEDVVGDPVNVAARLQQEAGHGDVVLGEATRRLVDAFVTLEPLGSFALRGRAGAVKAHRVVSLDAPSGATTAAFVGRETELGRIGAVYDDAVRTPATRLAVLLGSPGLGKSRLIEEFARRTGAAAAVVKVRCDAAGGATFAPLADALRELLGIEAAASSDAVRAAIAGALRGEDDTSRIASGIAALLTGSPAAPEETFFVVRRLLADLAAATPVVLVIDDLQWAEPLLLDLVEHLVQWGSGVPLLVLIGARPELRDVRSSLVTPGGLAREVVTLTGLDAGAATRLAANVIGAADLPAAVAAKVLATSEGNPLFIGELIRMLVEEGALTREGERWTAGTALATLEMPPTIHALLAARIERLRLDERTVLERAAVVGRQFSRSAVAALLPDADVDLDARLEALRRSELIERDTGWLLGEPVLRFHHSLIRDAAYRRLLKETRAELHERLADWMEHRVGDATMVSRDAASPEQDETIGRHLEQAYQLRGELGPLGPHGRRLGNRASGRLATAGRAALARDDVSLAAGLLGRAVGCLEPDDAARADLALDWCEALLAAGDVTQAASAIEELGRFAPASPRLRAWRACFAGQLTVLTAPEALRTTADEVAAAATELAALDDPAGESTAHYVQALALARLGQVGGCEAALDHALAAARRAGDRRRANTVLAIAPLAALWGPSPVTRASGRCLDVVRVLRITQGAPAVEAVALSCQGVLEALRGRTDAAKRMIASAREMVEELGIAQRLFEVDALAGLVVLLEGDGAAAERSLRTAYEGLRDLGLGIDAARAAALLARALLAQGRAADAEALSHESEALAGDDLKAAIAWRGVRAEALARRGEHAGAVELASQAAQLAEATDALLDHADARLALAVALRAAGRDREADAEERRATELWEAKGATQLVERAGHRRATAHVTASESQRPRGSTPRAPVAPNLSTAMLARDPSYRMEPLGTLGPTLVLARRQASASGATSGSYDVGPHEKEAIQLLEVDHDGVMVRSEVFACARLGDAVARLYERHAELLPVGPARDRAIMTARLVTAMLTPTSARLEDVMAPDIQAVDHRTVGGGPGGIDLWSRWRSASDELAAETAYRVDDVLALGTEGLLRRTTESGTIRATGGTFSNTSLLLSIFGADGRQSRFEMFDVGHEAEALARYQALTSGPAPSRRRARRMRANAATAWQERFDELGTDGRATRFDVFEAEQEAEALACFDELAGREARPPARRVRPNAATRSVDRFRAALAARDAEALGRIFDESLQIVHHPTGATYGRREMLATWRSAIRAEQLAFRNDVLATLGDGLLLERQVTSVDGLVESHLAAFGHTEVNEIAVIQADERERFVHAELFAPDQLERAIGRLYALFAELLPEGAERERAAAVARSAADWAGPIGSERRDEDVLARFEALVAQDAPAGRGDEPGVPAAPEPFANAAWRAWETGAALWSRRDRTVVETFHAHLRRYRDHRRQVLLDLDRDRFLEFAQPMLDIAGRMSQALLATRGERLALVRTTMEAADGDVGPVAIDSLLMIETDEQGRVVAYDRWDADDLDAALEALDGRFEAGEGATSRAAASLQAFNHALETRDWDALAARLAPGFRAHDHRTLGFGDTLGDGTTFVRLQQALVELSSDARYRYDHVRVTDRATLIRTTQSGTRDGGPFETVFVVVSTVDERGRTATMDVYDVSDLDEAVALFEAFSRGHAGRDERARFANAATRLNERFAQAWAARDWDGVMATLSPTCAYDDRRALLRTEFDAERGAEVGWRTLFDVPNGHWNITPIATRGERLALSRVVFEGDVQDGGGSLTIDMLSIDQVGDDGRFAAIAMFDPDDLDAAYTELDARWEVGEGSTVPRPARLVREFLGALDRRDWSGMETLLAPTVVGHDHRLVSWGTVRGATFTDPMRSLVDLAPDVRLRNDHLRVAGRGILIETAWTGTRDGGAFEIPFLAVVEQDAQGLVTRFDFHDPSRLDDAWARLREIAADDRDEVHGLAPQPNAAAVALERWQEAFEAAFATDDWDPMRALCAPGLVFEDRRAHNQLAGDVEMMIASARERARSGARPARRLLGTAGERVAVFEFVWRGGPADGPFEIGYSGVVEVDEGGRMVAALLLDDARAAQREAWARWARIDPAVEAVTTSLGEVIDAWNARDLEWLRRLFASDVLVDDHRHTGMGRSEGAEAYLRGVVALWELAPDSRFEAAWVWLGVAPHVAVFPARRVGVVPDGGEFESEFLVVIAQENGRTTHVEVFEPEDVDAALACFERLRSDSPPSSPTAMTVETLVAAWERRDTADVGDAVAPDFRFADRGKRALVEGDVDTWIGSMRFWPPGTQATADVFATLGDRITLDHARWTGPPGADSFEIERIRLVELDAAGRLRAVMMFDPDDRAAASVEALRRFAAGEGAGADLHAYVAGFEALSTRDWESGRAHLAPDFVYQDHRRFGLGTYGVDDHVSLLRELRSLVPDAQVEVLRIVRWNRRGLLVLHRGFGTFQGGGPFEQECVDVIVLAGDRVGRVESFDAVDVARAGARWDELCGSADTDAPRST